MNPWIEVTDEGEWKPLTRAGRWLVRIVGSERLKRFDAWAERAGQPPEPEERCPYLTPLGKERCVLMLGHRGSCLTHDYVYGSSGELIQKRPRYWWGINYTITKEPRR